MSALGGIYNFNGTPVDERSLLILGDQLATSGPDGGSELHLGSLGMTYRAFHTNKESRREVQPLISNGAHIMCWDGRLDNRDELIPMLRAELFGDHTDIEVVLAAYRRWGIGFLPRLIGDFALALWDPQSRALLLARDPAGPRPLFYHISEIRIVWSSELSALLQLAGYGPEVDDEYIAGFLTASAEPWLTPYKGIHAVPPGHLVLARGEGLRVQRFWGLDPNHEIRHRNDAEYEEHFRYLFREAVHCRLRVDGPVYAQLSGGLDSSSIVCMADNILETGHAEASKLQTISYVYDESTGSDERAFIHCVEEKLGRRGYHLRLEDYPPLISLPEKSPISFPDALDCFIERHEALCEAMRVDGARVLITGHGGDEIFCSSANPAPEMGDLLVQCQILRLYRRLRIWSQVLKKPYLTLLSRDAVMPLLPLGIQARWAPKPNLKLPPWFDSKFVSRMNLRERNLGPIDIFGFTLPSGQDQAIGFLSTVRIISRAAYRSRGLVEVSHPCTHRPLVEFMQAIPYEQRVRPGETRSLLRRSLQGLLPEKILKRKTKRGPDEAFARALARGWLDLQPLFTDSRVCARGYVNAEAFQTALNRARHGCERYSFALIQTISLEIWLRALERHSSIAKSATVAESVAMPAVAKSQSLPAEHMFALRRQGCFGFRL